MAGDGKELRDSLDKTQNNRLKNINMHPHILLIARAKRKYS